MGNAMIISKVIEFDAGHRVQNHASKCRNPHGHRYRVRVSVEGKLIEKKGASNEAMVMDFGSLKTILGKHVHDVYDHGFMVSKSDNVLKDLFDSVQAAMKWKVIYMEGPPTAEALAIDIWNRLAKVGVKGLHLIEVWETPTCKAEYNGQP